MPNLVAFVESRSSADSWVRWHVPFDDNSHMEFTARCAGSSSITGDPLNAASQILLRALE
jgi:hypothetical protein